MTPFVSFYLFDIVVLFCFMSMVYDDYDLWSSVIQPE